jgi:hypothetical protein
MEKKIYFIISAEIIWVVCNYFTEKLSFVSCFFYILLALKFKQNENTKNILKAQNYFY